MFPMSQFTSATAVGKEKRKQGSEWKVWAGCFGIPGILPPPSLVWLEVSKSPPEVHGGVSVVLT